MSWSLEKQISFADGRLSEIILISLHPQIIIFGKADLLQRDVLKFPAQVHGYLHQHTFAMGIINDRVDECQVTVKFCQLDIIVSQIIFRTAQ